MYNHHCDDFKRLSIQYQAVFNQSIPDQYSDNIRFVSLAIDYGIMGYDSINALKLALNHIKTQAFNKLMTDDVIFSMHKLPYRY